jgi:hypothetical protein
MDPTVVEVLAAVAVAVAEGKHVLCVIMDPETVVLVAVVVAKAGKVEPVVMAAAAPLEFILT